MSGYRAVNRVGTAPRLRLLLALPALTAGLLLGWGPIDSAHAGYQQFFQPVGKSAPPDPCAKLGVPDSGGLVVRTQPNPGQPSIPRYVALLCGPRENIPPSLLLVDDQIWQYSMGRRGHTSTHMIHGGQTSLPWNSGLSTHLYPYLKGPNGSSPNIDQALKNDTVRGALLALLLKAGIKGGIDALICLLGGLETGGGSCALLLEDLGVTAAIAAAIGADLLIDEFEMFLSRGSNMTNSDWFYWSNGVGFWNGLGDITSSWINPSINLGVPVFGRKQESRIGVVFSNVGTVQGPDFNLNSSAQASGDRRSDRLARLAAKLARGIPGKTLFGNKRPNRIRGSRHGDHIVAGPGDDRVFGRAGPNMINGGKGDDFINAGTGNDRVDGYADDDRIFAGRGNDLVFDLFGRDLVDAGGGRNVVVVRDGESGDRVLCTGSRHNVVAADAGDFVDRSCLVGRSKVVRDGPKPVVGPRSSRRR